MQTFLHYRWRVPSTLHRLHPRRIIPLLLLALCVTGAKAQTYQTYDANTCYTKALIDAKINDFAGNEKPMGFGSYNSEKDAITQPQWYKDIEKTETRNLVVDYVAGLVAKACIEAADYYKDFTWSKPWFKLVENYATKVSVPTTGASLDDLNASKMYFALAELTKPGAKYANSETYTKAITELNNAVKGLTAVNNNFSIRNSSSVNYGYDTNGNLLSTVVKDNTDNTELTPASTGMNAIGGWYHKATYPNQMWCDSEYMGPALLAQLVAYATNNSSAGIGTVTSSTEDDWKLIAKQFDITWNYLWNSNVKLLYHGFSATPTAIAAHTHTWATGTNGTNTAYWGRAIGWYFLALVDVLENMPNNIEDDSYIKTQNKLSSRNANIKTRLTSYLTELADGIWAQKKDNYLWTNVINEAVDTEHTSYSTTDAAKQSNTKNYLEASASAIYIAAYIKAMRLGLLPSGTYESGIKTAYSNYISTFITTDNNIINTCASAGLGGGDVYIESEQNDYKSGGKKYRNGTADYYTRGYDVTKVTGYQEGKPLGAFILASTEYERYMKADYAPSFTATNAEKPTAQTVTQGQSVTLHAAAMAKPLAEYQWYSYPASSTRATDTQGTPISDETSADLTVTPQANTYYYCVATNSAGTAQTDPVLVTVNEASNEGTNTPTEKVVTISLANKNNTCTDANSIVTVDVTKSQPISSSKYCKVARGNYFTVSSEKTITKIVISYEANFVPKKEGAVTVNTGTFVYNTSSTSSTWTGSATSVTFTDDSTNGNDLHITSIVVTYLDGTTSTLSITIQPVDGVTCDVNAPSSSVTPLSVTVTGTDGAITYQWWSNTTNSTEGGTPIPNATEYSYIPPVATAGTTYYYCKATAGGKTVTSEVVAVAVLNPSDLAINTQSNYKKNSNAWTPAVGGTISITDIVTSSSMGAYSITTGDAATLDGTSLTAVKDGTITLKQAADDNYQAGSIDITVRIGQNVTNNNTNEYSFTAATDVSDGMTIARKDITMTFGNDGFWKKPSEDGSYTQGQTNPVAPNNIPTKGTFYQFNATTTGSLKVKVRLGTLDGKLRPLYVSENGTLVKAKKGDGTGTVLDPTNMPAAYGNYDGEITFPVKANTDYYVYVPGSKLGFYGFTFTPLTLYTVTFNAGTNGTCSTTSLMQESAGATITLPSVTANAGYTFDGWYTAETGGNKAGDAGATYTPNGNITTLYAHYTATTSGGGSTATTGTLVFFTGSGTATSDSDVLSVTKGNMKSGAGVVSYKNNTLSNALKMEPSTSVSLTLSSTSDVVLVFSKSSSGYTINVDGTPYTIGSDGLVTVSSLSAGTAHTITRGSDESLFYAVEILSTAPAIYIITQPASAEYIQGAEAKSLSVKVGFTNASADDYKLSYKWYSRNSKEESWTNAGTGETCDPGTSGVGTTEYYCEVTATLKTDDTKTLKVESETATVEVLAAATIHFTSQPVGAVCGEGEKIILSASATTNFNGEVSYQWYSNTADNTSGTEISSDANSTAVTAHYVPSTATTGITTYYYCVASATYSGNTYTKTSNVVSVKVATAYSTEKMNTLYSSSNLPKCNEQITIKDGSEKLVTLTFGGWKYNSNKYTKPASTSTITDSWNAPVQGPTPLDGFEYAVSGANDAVQENKSATMNMYNKVRYGWFQSPTRDENGNTTESHPYTLPVRGAYMTFEPTKNGTLTVYLLQNGAWNSDTKNKIDIIPGEFRMHAFQITNQRGLVLEEFAPQYSITTEQKVAPDYFCTTYAEADRPETFDKTSKDISQWEEFWSLTEKERKAVHDNWNNGIGGSQTIIKLENGSFLAIQKAIVKYKFHVTGNETYYMFSNFSKLGFCGATFIPDPGQPDDVTTFSGDKSLSDVKAYTKITPEWDDESYVPGTNMPNYTFKIDGKEVGKVDGVFIPQFKAITLNREFKKDRWTTLSLPFNLTQTEVEEIFGKGTEILVFKDAITEGTKLHIKFIYHEIQNILPSYPYLIKPTLVGADGKAMTSKATSTDQTPTYTIGDNGNLTSFTVYGKAINPLLTPQKFTSTDKLYVAQGTPGYCTPDENGGYSKKYDEGDLFISEGDGKLYISKGSSYGKGYRSYIDYTGTDTSASTKTLSLTFSGVEDGEGDGTTTEISVAELADDVIEAFGIKGVYNLNGQKVAETTRNLPAGIYVVNGRKVVVK